MKHIKYILLILALTVPMLRAQMPPGFPGGGGQPNAGGDQNNSDNEIIPPGMINFEGVDVRQVLDVYAHLVGKTMLMGNVPQATIVLKTETNLTKTEAIQALQAVLALNHVSLIDVPGGKFVKVVGTDQAAHVGETFSDQNPSQIAELGSYMTRIVQLKFLKPSEVAPVLQQFASSPDAVMPIEENGILVLRDNPENIKRMMEMLAKVDVIIPAQYISKVIPIKYAMADDIASVLSSLENPGGGTASFGQTSTPGSSGLHNGSVGGAGGSTMGNGFGNGAGGGGFNGSSGYSGQSGFGSQQTSQGSSQSPFANRLQNILNRVQNPGGGGGGGAAGGMQQPIQILGQTKIIADERSNSLLIYATPEDMKTIEDIVSKLDVLLAQVLIESVIMEVDLNKSWNYGISVAQNPTQHGSVNGGPIQTVGAINNGTPFYSFTGGTNTWPGNFTSSALSGLSYFGNIGPNWDVALNAAASDSSIHIVQRPRIQTSQAKEAQFFVGESVPYVTSTYEAGAYGNGGSSYSQLQVGISLDVTPFINPDGLVVLDINQQINDISGNVPIEGVGNVPTTDNRTFTSEVAVKDRDTIILGGFTDTETDKSSSGVPILQDIPIIGNLFKSPSSQKTRDELLVMMRPTVLRTPEAASIQAVKEEVRSPGISGAERDERSVVNQERKNEAAQEKQSGPVIEPTKDADGMYNTNGAPQ